jgi:hypothetical protein
MLALAVAAIAMVLFAGRGGADRDGSGGADELLANTDELGSDERVLVRAETR